MNSMIGTTLSHYAIISKLGAGGMGEVYRWIQWRVGRRGQSGSSNE